MQSLIFAKEQFALFVIDIRLLPLLFNFSANISVCSVSPDTDNAIVAVLSPFPRNTGVNGSSIANENQPTLLKYLAPYFPIKEEFPTPTNIIDDAFVSNFTASWIFSANACVCTRSKKSLTAVRSILIFFFSLLLTSCFNFKRNSEYPSHPTFLQKRRIVVVET